MAVCDLVSSYQSYNQNNSIGSVSGIACHVLLQYVLRNKLISILGHSVLDNTTEFVNYLYKHPSVNVFKNARQQVSMSCSAVSFDQVVNHVVGGMLLSKNPSFPSFEYLHRKMKEVVAPILCIMGVPATFFVTMNILSFSLIDYQNVFF
jgi:hypothetical protein